LSDQTSQPPAAGPWRTGRSARTVDDVDRRILAELTRDGRLSVRALAERAHISRANAYARVNQLLADGVITGFEAQIDPERAGLGTSAYVLLTIQQNTWREVAAALNELPYIEHFALVGGDFDVLALVRAPDNAALRHVVLERIQEIDGVRGTRTWLIFDEHDGRGVD
jgi:DNA-binding Lrp family transcriptional regulator